MTSVGTPSRRVSVVVCAYSADRWNDLRVSLESAVAQSHQPAQVVLVVDHNEALLRRARAEIVGVEVIANCQARGLSGARNTGIARCHGDVVAFLDDDAYADREWLAELLLPYADPAVAGVGGWVTPDWAATRPTWWPHEFNWVVGCSYVGLPAGRAEVRNPIGANMSFRRDVFSRVGGFSNGTGRIGTHPAGCEETEFSIRVRQHLPGSRIVLQPTAIVFHRVPLERARRGYFLRRCYHEGMSKARITRAVGRSAALESERRYVRRTLLSALRRDLRPLSTEGVSRSLHILGGLGSASVGYCVGAAGLGGR